MIRYVYSQLHGGSEPTQGPTQASTQAPATTVGVLTTGSGGIYCPSPDGYFEHPDNCNQYIQCAHGTPYVNTCASGLYFNASTHQCDWSFNVNCSKP